MTVTPSVLRYLALGDSYTCGEGVAPAERWPEQLASRLRDGSRDFGEVRIVARTGWTTQELAAGIEQAGLQPPYDLVSLQIGVNNQYRGHSPESYRDSLRALLAHACKLAGGHAHRVLVPSIPDWGDTPHARQQQRDRAQVARELDAYNALARDEAARAGARWIDITPLSRQTNAGWIGADGLHPTGAQYAAWVGPIEVAARAALRAPLAPPGEREPRPSRHRHTHP
jgi:lysophospholipase L1-like esterase